MNNRLGRLFISGFGFGILTYEEIATLGVSAFNEYLETNQIADEILRHAGKKCLS